MGMKRERERVGSWVVGWLGGFQMCIYSKCNFFFQKSQCLSSQIVCA
jgi:hypothetical protein